MTGKAHTSPYVLSANTLWSLILVVNMTNFNERMHSELMLSYGHGLRFAMTDISFFVCVTHTDIIIEGGELIL